MRTAHLFLATAVVVSGVAFTAPAQAARGAGVAGPVETNLTATTRDLGTLGGFDGSWAYAMDGDIVVGSSDTPSGGEHAFAYDLAAAEPALIDLGTLGGSQSHAHAVDGTIVVGSSDTARRPRAFAYDLAAAQPALIDLGTLGKGEWSTAAAVDGTVVVGTSHSARKPRAFTYDLSDRDPVMRGLGTMGGALTWAHEIEGDVVLGRWEVRRSYRGFAYDLGAADPHFVDLGPAGRGDSTAYEIDDGVVVGWVESGSGERATAWHLRETTRPMIAFPRVTHRAAEGHGRVTIEVVRYGRTDRAVTVRYRTRNDTAEAGQDFVATSGKLRFPRGVTRRSFEVRILNDRRSEGKEYLYLVLSRPGEPALLGTPSWSELRIRASDR